MPAKTQRIYELMVNTSKALSQDYKVWQIFLNTAAWQYKYPFNDQLLIFAQRPDAKACARIDVWNNAMHRWVNRGSKGIALLRENGNRMGLEYVFDVSDTHSRRGNDVRLWKYDESHEDAVIETLENTFGELKVKTTIYDAVLCAAHNAVQDNKVDYLNELKYVKGDSFLSGLDNVNLDLRFRQTAEASVAYMILERMGLEPEDMLDYAEFEYIRDFNTPETMNILGSAVSAISEDALRSISQTIRAEEKIKKFAKKENSVYNKSEKNIDSVNIERNEENGRSSIQDSRRLSDTRLDSTDGGTHDRQIRNDAQDVSEGTPQVAVLNTDDEGRTDEPLGGNRQDGDGAGGENRVADGESGGRDGTDESKRPIEMDRTDEQFSSFSRGNRVIGNGVQLSIFDIPLPSEEEQKNMIEQAERNNIRPAFSMPQQIIDEVLTSGANERNTILDIGVQYSKGKSDNIEFLKDHYGTGGKGFIFNDNKVSAWWNADGMRIAYGDTAIGKGQLLSWEQVDARIGELLELGRYAPQETLDKLDEHERKQAAISFYEMYRDTNCDEYPELKEHFNTEWFSGSYPDTIDKISELFKQAENVDFAISVTQKMNELYADNKNVMRFRYYSPNKVLPVIKDLQLEHKHFMSDITANPPQRFITEDEIDKLIIGDTQYNTPKIERYLYFKEHTDIKERVKFLKSQYHTGGVASGLFSYDYNSKGMSFSRGDIFSPFAKVNMTWRNVANRIDKLIKSGRYLNERELAEDLPKYLSAQEQLKIRSERIQFLNNTENLTPQERQQTLPKRLFYYINTIDFSDKRKFEDGGLPELINANELEIADFIKDGDKRQQLIGCLRTIQSKTGDVHARSNAYWLANDLEAVKVINLQKVGDFYEVYGDEAEEAAKILDLTLTSKIIDGDTLPMVGFPVSIAERNSQILNDNGYLVSFLEDNKEQQAVEKTFYAYALTIVSKVVNDESYINACLNSDKSNAKLECDAAVKRAILTFSPENASELYKLYFDMPEFHKRIHDYSFEQTYDIIRENEMDVPITDEPQQEQTEDYSQYIGTELTIDGSKFIVDSISTEYGNVSLRDASFQEKVGYPIFRGESLEWLKRVLAEQTKETEQPQTDLTPNFSKPKPKVENTVIYPDIPMSERHNFKIQNDELGHGTPSEKYAANVAAIRTLKQVEADHRLATPEEQEILSRYVGWGGLADCFDEKHSKYGELKSLLTDEEYTAARESTLTAFYTPPVVIRSIYKALGNMGFSQGNILDPAAGVGNFEGMLPDNMTNSRVYGIEIDKISGRIAQQLYQKNSIAIQGYEDTTLPDSFFDVAVGNVPFGNFKVLDKKYNKHNFLIHDYFFAKTLDKVRPGGVVAFITSSGTMDKRNSNVRKYIAQRADLVGAIRLPNNTFKANAGTEVTSDILFLQKRDRMTDILPEWVHVGTDDSGHTINQYFIDNPDMVLGDITDVSGPFGMQTVCLPYEGADLAELLDGAIQNINTEITEYEFDDISNDEDMSIPADPDVKNFSFTVVDGDVYFRENSRMNKVDVSLTAANRIKGLIEIRDCVKELIEYQTLDFPDYEIKKQQYKLNNLYDNFTKKYGLINSRGNDLAFASDSSYFLLCSLEVIDENGNLERKADMFTKRTIGAKKIVTHVDTSSEALAVSIGEKAKIDMEFMSELTGKTEQEIFEDLKGVIFLNPLYDHDSNTEEKYLPADAYLSGNVRKKLSVAKSSAEQYPDDYNINVEALTAVQPKDLSASEITVRLGTTWIPIEYIKEFTFELLTPSLHAQRNIDVKYSKLTGDWNIIGKHFDKNNIKANNTYGTYRASAYKIIEDTLNLRDTRVFDYVENEKGNRVAVLNKKETMIAQQKQDAIKSAFSEWIWKSPERRERLTKIYNEKFNSIRPREYDGSHITFSGMNPEIVLRKHQQDAVARIMYGGNSLLGHVVGAGKTWTMVAAAMESKRLGLCNKSLFVVPNHLTEQWASEFLQLYPAANILVATKKDFEMKNRKKFCGRIATGEYDAVIIGHSQFEKIPMSVVRQRIILQNQLHEITNGIIDAKTEKAENFTIKQLEKTRRGIKAKLERLNDTSRKDDVVTFEELGVDRLFIDEAHYYKNLYLYTKMRNVGGIAQTEAQKSSDLFMKCRYLDEITGGKGTIFATGTPISNSMVELYTMQRYLQYDTLEKNDLIHFDEWASTFGETVTAIELAPEGTGYRAKTRFAKFFNLPELMAMFKEVADIQTADMLKLPVPEAEYHNVAVEPTETQREMVAQLAERAEDVRNRKVEPNIDNMLKITNDGRKLALDQRLINDMLPDEENTKVAACADNVYKIWNDTADIHGTQLVFCDLSTPKNDGKFNVYDDIKCKLIEKGIPENEIAFIHNANTEVQKKDMFARVRSGEIRVLFGSTQKMGAGTNVQKHLYALHDLDCPWRPSDLEQRSGRIIRQGNDNETVHIFRYVTKDTFDAYLYQLVENKQKFISQIMTSKSPVRSAEDIDETALSYAEIKSLATGNPHIKEKMDLDMQVAKLKVIKSNFMTQKYELEDKVIKYYPSRIKELTERISGMEKDIKVVEENPKIEDKFNPMTIDGLGYFEKKKAGAALIDRCKKMTTPDPVVIGEYRGFTMILSFDTIYNEHKLTLQNAVSYSITLGSDEFGNIQRIDNALADIASKKTQFEQTLTDTKNQFEFAKTESKKEFPQEAELKEKMSRLAALDALLNMDKRGNDGVVMDEPDDTDMPKKKNRDMER